MGSTKIDIGTWHRQYLTHNMLLMKTTRKRQQLVDRLIRAAEVMVQGSLSRTTRTCGQPSCRCQRGERHGPHTYLTFRTPERRSTSLYVPTAKEPQVRRAIAAWKRFGELAASLAEDNRRQLLRPRRSDTRKSSHARKA